MTSQIMTNRLVRSSALMLALVVPWGCSGPDGSGHQAVPMHPFADGTIRPSGRSADELPPPIQIAGTGGTARGSAQPVRIDTRTFDPQVDDRGPWKGETKRPGEILPKHSRDKTLHKGVSNELRSGGVTERPRVDTEFSAFFPGILQSPWTPPDPTIAVGPNHVVETVNMEIAWFDKEGTMLFQQRMDSSGDPGFFEELGAGDFTFDPKCFYDPIRNRYVVLALEHYSGEAWITLAISDDDDPEGIWFKYRTWSIVDIDDTTYWIDYPGFGFDNEAWYVTCNLFKDSGDGPGFGGTLLRSLDPEGGLLGEELDYVDIVLLGGSHQVAQVPDGDSPTVLVRGGDSTSMQLVHVSDPLGSPTITETSSAVPEYAYPNNPPPTPGGSPLNPLDGRMMNVMLRNGHLWTGHTIRTPDDPTTVARWYDFDLDGWPADSSGVPTLEQSGEVRPSSGAHTCYPAIAVNGNGNAAVVYTQSSNMEFPSLYAAGRVPLDPPGTLGASQILATSTDVPDWSGSYRWGDYFDATMDPVNDNVYWVVGEIYTSDGWVTEISSFVIEIVGDIDGDGAVTGADLSALLGAWGTDEALADLNHDGIIDGKDLTILLGNWG